MAEDRSTKAFKGLSQKETREKLIRDRAARLKRDAEKQGITPAELAKKKRDTYVKVVGGAASLLPIGRIISMASKGFKALSAGAKAAKTAKTAKAVKAAKSKTKASAAGARAKSAAKSRTRESAAGARAKSSAKTKVKADRKPIKAERKPVKAQTKVVSKAPKKPSGMVITRTKVKQKPPAKSSKITTGDKLLAGATAVAAGTAALAPRGQKKAGASVTGPTSRPKRPSVTGPTSRPKRKGPGVGRTDKTDPRKGFGSKATPGKKKVAPTPKRKPKDKLDPRGNQIKAISSLPAGALRKFQGSYDKKKEKLRNIGGKTYVVKR